MKRYIYICKKCGFEYGGPDGTPLSCSYCGTVNDLAYAEGDEICHKNGNVYLNMEIKNIKKKCLCCGCEISVSPWIIQDFCNRCYPVVLQEVFDKNNDNLTVEQLKNKIQEKLRLTTRVSS